MKKIDFRNKSVIAGFALLGVSLIASGVFASASINLNSGQPVNLGAGKAEVMACDETATLSTQQTYNEVDHRYELASISITDLNTAACLGKTIRMTLDYELCASPGSDCSFQTPLTTSWSGFSSSDTTLTWNGTTGSGATAATALTPLNTANIGTAYIAISAE